MKSLKLHRYSAKKQNGGFTLIEVMAALAVVAVGISAAVGVVSSLGINVAKLEEKAVSQWIISNRLVELRLQQFQAKDRQALLSNASSTVTMGARDWYVFETSKLSDPDAIVETSVQVCMDQSKSNCPLVQQFYLAPLNLEVSGL